MIQTVRVTQSEGVDPIGCDVWLEVRRSLGLSHLEAVRTAKVYRFEGVSGNQAHRLARRLLAEDVHQVYSLNAPLLTDASAVVEVAYRPGVMNPEAASIAKAAADLGVHALAVDSSREYAFYGRLSESDVNLILERLLVNATIERVVHDEPHTLRFELPPATTETIALRTIGDAELMALSDGRLFLNLDELHAIQAYFASLGRDPTDCEVEVLAQTWSEHCAHKTFKASIALGEELKLPMMTRLRRGMQPYAPLVLSAFVDNSGVMEFYDGWAICGKVETHNSPSAIEPYGGAMTGSGGVFRDVMGTGRGAAVMASTDMFCLAPPDLDASQVPPGCLHPDFLLRKVVAGVRDYGNRMGIPTNNGSVHFHPDFRAKPSVIVGAYGLLPAHEATRGRPNAGNRILVLGGRTGRDGIHGATFSSAEMTEQTMQTSGSAVQIGNAVEEKRLLDALIACRAQGFINAVTDCGAGGFSSAIGEMAAELGAVVHLERAPLKYSGLAPWEIFLSEAQERMVLAVAPANVEAVLEICRRYNVEATDVGSFEQSGHLRVLYHDQLVCDLDMHFLHHGRPERVLTARYVERTPDERLPEPPADWAATFAAVLAHLNVCSKEPIVRQYDHSVQGTSALPPFSGVRADSPNDAAVITPLLGKPYGVVLSHGLHPVLVQLDPYWGSVWAATEALANLVAVGGSPREASLIDNFVWPVPDEELLGDLDRAVDALVDVMHAYELPVISGKDSLSSTYRGPKGLAIHIPPVVCVSAMGRIADVSRTVSADFKRVGSSVLLVGQPDFGGMGGSAYFDLHGLPGARPPRVDLETTRRVFEAVHAAVVEGAILACHDISQGGLGTALAEMCFGGEVGADLELAALGDVRPDFAMFNETAGCFLVELADAADGKRLLSGVPCAWLGTTTDRGSICVGRGGDLVCEAHLDDLKAAWQAPMQAVFH